VLAHVAKGTLVKLALKPTAATSQVERVEVWRIGRITISGANRQRRHRRPGAMVPFVRRVRHAAGDVVETALVGVQPDFFSRPGRRRRDAPAFSP